MSRQTQMLYMYSNENSVYCAVLKLYEKYLVIQSIL